ncbi:MAG: AAA family ATPase [Clostridia bacterium]|nr:AAA family ATPase [Clostridia bacterium]
MKKQELNAVFSSETAVIQAPAGHGKTEMIVDMVDFAEGKQLLLTHTHAGVDALKKRLDLRKIPKNKYFISTIAAFCIRWGSAYNHTASINTALSPYKNRKESQLYYSQFYSGTNKLFEHKWAGEILKQTYSGIIVDEYQDCLQIHHEIFKTISQYLPVRVLGDPLQGIFSFSGQMIVDWNNIEFTTIDVETKPWRWEKTNWLLGQYLTNIRKALLPTLLNQRCTVTINSCNGSISVLDPDKFDVYSILKELTQYNTVLYITKWEQQQANFCIRHPGIFQLDEKQDCEDLYKYAELFSNCSGASLMLSILEFVSKCATKVNTELSSYKNRLVNNNFDFSHISKHKDFGQLITNSQSRNAHELIADMLCWFENNSTFKFYRKELFYEMIRSVKYSREHAISIYDSAIRIRKDPSLQKKYQSFKFLSSRTLLSKGLEFDCVIIDMSTPLSVKEFYVAMTRAMKKIYILSSSSTFVFDP